MRKGDAALRSALCEPALLGVGTLGTCINARFRRFRRRFGAQSEDKTLFTVAHTLVVIICNVLATDGATWVDLGPDWFQQRDDTQAHVPALSDDSSDSASSSMPSPLLESRPGLGCAPALTPTATYFVSGG